MKITDYCPRAAPFDVCLIGKDLVGVEVGVDVGAHAEAILTYCPVAMLHLVDPWPNIERKGYCDGRLSRFRGRYELHRMKSLQAAHLLAERQNGRLDFIYLDQEHDADSVRGDLEQWWTMLRPGGILGHRNYVEGRGSPLEQEIDKFIFSNKIEKRYENYQNDMILFKK